MTKSEYQSEITHIAFNIGQNGEMTEEGKMTTPNGHTHTEE